MKSRPLLLVGVLFTLFIIPLSFLNVSAITYQYSPESVTSFSETLDNDVHFSPDGFYDPTPISPYAGGGNVPNRDWEDSMYLDGIYWTADDEPEYALYAGTYSIEGFEYSIYGRAVTGNGSIVVYDTMIQDYRTLVNITEGGSDSWYNGSYWGTNYHPEIAYLRIFADDEPFAYIAIDYIELRFHYATLYDYSYSEGMTHWAESFTNVSDWVVVSGSALSTDGDVMTITHIGDSNWDTYECDTPSLTGTNYVEFRLKWGTDAGSNNVLFSVNEEDDWSGAAAEPLGYLSSIPDSYTTYKAIIEQDVESIRFAVQSTAADTLLIDYVRIGPSNEMGWQHDASTLIGITDGSNCVSSTNGDKITITSSSSVVYSYFSTDVTSTGASISETYYPFIEYSVSSVNDADSDGGVYRIRIYGDDGNEYLQPAYVDDTGIFRYNIVPTASGNPFQVRVWMQDSGESVTFDYIKFYSIANYTLYMQAGVETPDYAYVEDGTLRTSKTSVKYIKFMHDPTLAVSIASFNLWEYSSNDIDPTETTDINVQFYIDGGWGDLTADNATGELSGTTLTNIQFFVYSALNISAVNFRGIVPSWLVVTNVNVVFWVSGWHIITSIIIIFLTEISTYAINLFLLFLGLIMIPTSTLYLVKGGRSEMSMDKVFFGTVVFILGCALFLGGIFA